MGESGERLVEPLGFVNFTRVISRSITRLILMESLLPERSANFYSVLSIRHLHISHNAPYFPPKFCLIFVFNFSWGLQPSQEKLKTMLMQNFGGQFR